ncbi:hypothetical protein HBO01_03415 [Pseudomonas rhodesiae]|jgi:hypothetical protein|uniref:hypothetical protein n=1 Tax=Pseudomonas rhodesiae TaxID=76760 RepID=UPI001476105C|nr:hypothetical protein [Pseudomonas rhodesiae]NMY77725.1 hypothetical protein [Pseudomonas rhodesiae]
MKAKEITFTATSILSEPTSSNWVRVTADADPSEVLQCFELSEIKDEFGADALLEHIGIEQVRAWLEYNT